MSNIEINQLIKEVQTYGYTIIPQGFNHLEYLPLIDDILVKEGELDNKSFHKDRGKDKIIYNLQNKHKKFINLLTNQSVKKIALFF